MMCMLTGQYEIQDFILAKRLLFISLSLRERLLGAHHPLVATTCCDLGNTFLRLYERATTRIANTVEQRDREEGVASILTFEESEVFCGTQSAQPIFSSPGVSNGKPAWDGSTSFDNAEYRETTVPPTAASQRTLPPGACRNGAKELFEQAEQMMLRAIEVRRASLGEQHPFFARLLLNPHYDIPFSLKIDHSKVIYSIQRLISRFLTSFQCCV